MHMYRTSFWCRRIKLETSFSIIHAVGSTGTSLDFVRAIVARWYYLLTDHRRRSVSVSVSVSAVWRLVLQHHCQSSVGWWREGVETLTASESITPTFVEGDHRRTCGSHRADHSCFRVSGKRSVQQTKRWRGVWCFDFLSINWRWC